MKHVFTDPQALLAELSKEMLKAMQEVDAKGKAKAKENVIKACITSGIQMQEYIPNNVSKWTTAIETAITSYSIVAQNGNFASGTVYIIGR